MTLGPDQQVVKELPQLDLLPVLPEQLLCRHRWRLNLLPGSVAVKLLNRR
jgi:hypothetical protein